MKIVTTVFLIFLFNISFTNNMTQFIVKDDVQLICYYTLIFKPDSTDQYSHREITTVLQVGHALSKFQSYGNFFLDSVLQVEPDIDFLSYNKRFSPPRSAGQMYRIFKNSATDSILTIDYIFPDSYIYAEQISFDWQLAEESEEHMGYNVQKATTSFGGRHWIAWFTPEIPISEGPYKFHGLPGLILKIEDSQKHYAFTLRSISQPKPDSGQIINNVRRSIETTKDHFFKYNERFRQDVIGGMLSSGMPLHENTDFDRIQENIRRHNNPIELTVD